MKTFIKEEKNKLDPVPIISIAIGTVIGAFFAMFYNPAGSLFIAGVLIGLISGYKFAFLKLYKLIENGK